MGIFQNIGLEYLHFILESIYVANFFEYRFVGYRRKINQIMSTASTEKTSLNYATRDYFGIISTNPVNI